MPMKKNSEAGFSMIQVLISVAVLSLAIFLYFQAQSRSQSARKIMDSSLASGDVKEAFIAEISTMIRQISPATPGCLDYAAQLNARPLVKSFGNSALSFTNAVSAGNWISNDLDAAEKQKVQAKVNGTFAEVVKRCQTPQRPGNPNAGNDNKFYLCMNIRSDANAPKNTFLNAPLAFAEVGWTLTNLHNGNPDSCADFAAASKSAGAQVFYTLYWAVPVNGDYVIKKNSDSFTLGK
ncbi:MAG TPA: hypothetical protein VFO10_10860 [Oligoflexus sp.]|uniref:type IV pilus modification PilV family protein n=1 Tax=Oligoflexus sp. TaxID=1971216 RepID=UPI002D7ED3C6|nr:hypothetical protein [Oligoflexus sp.]HET9237744.1 hypothetical protein [Oligoflexus sp.]